MLSTIYMYFHSNFKPAHHQVVTIIQVVLTASVLLLLASMYAAKPRSFLAMKITLKRKRIETHIDRNSSILENNYLCHFPAFFSV